MAATRRYDIDWIRVLVFDILILYHIACFFVPWPWHIKNNDTVSWLEYPMTYISQWRLPILFLVSGIGTRFALSYRTGAMYLTERVKGLLIPLVFGILVVIPPQIYIERLVAGDTSASFIEFYPTIFSSGLYPEGNLTWNHLWFLFYLLLFSIFSTPLFLFIRNQAKGNRNQLASMVAKYPFLLYVPVLLLVPNYYFLVDKYPGVRNFFDDWYSVIYYYIFFISGYVFISIKEVFWKLVVQYRYTNLMVSFVFTVLLYMVASENVLPRALVKMVMAWSTMLAIIGFSARYLNKESAVIAYRNKAVYPFYIVHQTVIIVLGYFMINWDVHYGYKMALLVIGTFSITWILYEGVIVKWKLLQPFFGVK